MSWLSEMLAANPPIYMEENLRDMVTLAKSHGAKTILTTWTFSVAALRGNDLRLGTPEYQAAVAEQNVMIRRLAGELGAILWDLAAVNIPPEDFVDGSHFNGPGNHHRAALLADLLESELGGEM